MGRYIELYEVKYGEKALKEALKILIKTVMDTQNMHNIFITDISCSGYFYAELWDEMCSLATGMKQKECEKSLQNEVKWTMTSEWLSSKGINFEYMCRDEINPSGIEEILNGLKNMTQVIIFTEYSEPTWEEWYEQYCLKKLRTSIEGKEEEDFFAKVVIIASKKGIKNTRHFMRF